jgi:hypothetical protein
MKIFTIGCYLFLSFIISACSSTAKVNSESQSDHYYAKNFTHNEFTTFHKDSVKKEAYSDQQLMLSLLNRAMPEDQRMMLAFAKRQDSYLPDSSIVGIQIKGDKRAEGTKARVISNYAHIIEQDDNAVMISAMPR